MALNPELRRNLWLELTPQRLVAAPLIIGLILLVVWAGSDGNPGLMSRVATYIFVAVALLWGTRRAAGALLDEVAGGTWDQQRLSVLGAWPMTWGKLLGATAFVWYCGLLALAGAVLAPLAVSAAPPPALELAKLLAAGLFGQAVALFAALLLLRRQRQTARGLATFCQFLGILAGFQALSGGITAEIGGLEALESSAAWRNFAPAWYGVAVDHLFNLASLMVFLAWVLAGSARLMAEELHYRQRPWFWLAFLAFVVAYCAGFTLGQGEGAQPALRLAVAVPPLLALTYAALFAEPKTWIRQRAFYGALAEAAPRRLWAALPLWLPAYLALAAVCLVALALLEPQQLPTGGAMLERVLDLRALPTFGFVLAFLLFVLRDILLVLALNLGGGRRADLAALVYLAVLHVLANILLIAAGLRHLRPLIAPVAGEPLPWTVGPAALQVLALLLWLLWRYRQRVGALRRETVAAE